ncbi:GNAT family N-acetyltransferase [Streptomyces sp. AM 4-1-1]|uniref:GNAT family N-acetyltransferase n=1 Tax=Streptomyces sp. AM 4-1-1 TaxID=3028710 RepID=UPI0023B90216|nr:GNAT family N-acetyltransferase [Streptomyces sp. AM 4-1-1]WEH34978.1 GNAT family N-acetyltransferase [Streptomyces sp. AM 4-1-1]
MTTVRRSGEMVLLGHADLDACLRLAEDRDWPPELRAWSLLLEFGEVYGVRDDAGGLAATVSLLRYGPRLATLGAMLVARKHAGQGMGGRLLRQVLDRVTADCVWLTATPQGVPLYSGAGFRAVGRQVRFEGVPDPTGPLTSRTASVADLAGAVRLDAKAFGAARPRVLAYLLAVAEEVRVVDGCNGIAGYGARWNGVDADVIGPVVATSDRVATTLLSDLVGGAVRPVRVDLDPCRTALTSWAVGHGLRAAGGTDVMVFGGEPPGERHLLVASATGAVG